MTGTRDDDGKVKVTLDYNGETLLVDEEDVEKVRFIYYHFSEL